MTFIGYIYKLTGSCGNVYIGSTKNYYQRKFAHNTNYNTSSSKNLKKPLQFEVIRKDEYKLVKTMYLVEQYYIDIHKCVNNNRAYINDFIRKQLDRERKQSNMEQTLKQQRERYQTIKEEKKKKVIANYHKTKIQVNCPYCNKQSTNKNLKQHQKGKKCRQAQANKQINL